MGSTRSRTRLFAFTFAAAVAAFAVFAGLARSSTINVCPVCGFTTIQSAVNAANPGDTIVVSAGVYAENVTVNKPLTLQGAQAGVDARTRSGAETIVDGTSNGGRTPFDVTSNDVTIDGFTVQGATNGNLFGFGIVLAAGTSGGHIVNDIVQNNIVGLSVANANSSDGALIQHDVFRNNNDSGPASGDGIYTDQFNAGGASRNVTIDSNLFAGNDDAGIDISPTDTASPATGWTISNNTFDGNGRGMLAFVLTSSMISGNTFENSTSNATADIRLFEGVNGLTITGNTLENGAGRALRVSDAGTGLPLATNVHLNLNSITGYAVPFNVEVDEYNGTFDATCNWWGSVTGPTTPGNPGGTGSSIGGTGAFAYTPWELSSTGPCGAAQQLNSGTTTRNGFYTGTGKDVVVPGGATCTLLPGTSVTHDTMVQKGGTLNANGVSFGHDVSENGPNGGTVCNSTVGHDLSVQNGTGSITICNDNVSHDLSVQNNSGPVSVTGNTVGHDLTVKNNKPGGATVSGNSSGHDSTCQGNSPQSGSGNSAAHSNSCPA